MTKARIQKKADKAKHLHRLEHLIQKQNAELFHLENELKTYRTTVETLIRGVRDGLLAMDGDNYKYLSQILADRLTRFLESDPR